MNEKTKTIIEKAILPVLLVIITVILVFQIETLKSDVRNLMNSVVNSVDDCYYSLDNFSSSQEEFCSSLEETLIKQNSIISKVDYKYGKLKDDNRTAEVIISVTPKTLTEDTTVSVKIGEKSLNAARTDESTFTAIYEADIFIDESYENIIVTVTSNGVSTTEVVEEFSFTGEGAEEYIDITSLYYQYLPIVEFYDETDYSVYYQTLFKLKGTLYNSSSVGIKNSRMVVEINGKVFEEKSIDLNKKEPTINKSYSIEPEDVVNVYIAYEDTKYGYTYKRHLRYRTDDMDETPYVDFVYDKDGKLLNAETDNLESYCGY